MATAKAKHLYGTYSGTVAVSTDKGDDNEAIIARAKARMRRKGLLALSMAHESFKVAGRED